jgi:hypothetical protein
MAAMLHSRPTRRSVAIALAAIVALSALPRRAHADDAALAFAQSLYALPNLWQDVTADPVAIARYLAPDLAALVTANYAKSNGDAALDYDPLAQAQDFDNVSATFTVDHESDTEAVITAAVKDFGDATTVVLTLANTPNGWRLADLKGPDGPSLVDELKQLNATPE